MLIVCPTCVSTYRVDPEIVRLSQGGVRCAHCRRLWVAGDTQAAGLNITGSLGPSIERDRIRMVPVEQQRPPAVPRHLPTAPTRSGWFVGAGFVLVLGAATLAIGLRRPIVQAMPATASLYASLGLPTEPRVLRLTDVKTEMVQEGATPVLTLEGLIQNNRADVVHVPNIRIVVRDGAEQSLYTWTAAAPKPTLAPGETVAFKSRLVAPPGDGHDVRVGFTDAHVAVSDAVVKGTR